MIPRDALTLARQRTTRSTPGACALQRQRELLALARPTVARAHVTPGSAAPRSGPRRWRRPARSPRAAARVASATARLLGDGADPLGDRARRPAARPRRRARRSVPPARSAARTTRLERVRDLDDRLDADHPGEPLDRVQRAKQVAHRPRARRASPVGGLDLEQRGVRRATISSASTTNAPTNSWRSTRSVTRRRACWATSRRASSRICCGANGFARKLDAPASSTRSGCRRRRAW